MKVKHWNKRYQMQNAVISQLKQKVADGYDLTDEEICFYLETVQLFKRYNPEVENPLC